MTKVITITDNIKPELCKMKTNSRFKFFLFHLFQIKIFQLSREEKNNKKKCCYDKTLKKNCLNLKQHENLR